MSDEFDPYQQWLGIAKHEQPANFYRLLGVGTLMEDREAIGNAADRQMNFVRTFQLGQHREASQKILRELAEAKLCLLNPESKAAYDAELRQQAAAPQTPAPPSAPAAPAPPPTPVAAPPAAPKRPEPMANIPLVEPAPRPSPPPASLARERTERSGGLPQWVWIVVAILLTLIVFAWMISRIAESRRAARAEKKRPKKPAVEVPLEIDGPSVAQNPDGTVTCAAALAVFDGDRARIVTEGADTFITGLEGPGDGAQWTFDLEKGQRGIFKVVVEYACPQGAEGGEFRVSVNGKSVKGTHKVHPTGGATTFVRAEIGFVKVQRLERNKLELAVDSSGPGGPTIMNVRAIRLKTVQKGVNK